MARDKLHDIVKKALVKDGWTITHDPYILKMYPGQEIDLAAEKLIVAERGIDKIAVEVKELPHGVQDLQVLRSIKGQYISYDIGIGLQEPERLLYLAIPEKVFDQLMEYTTVPMALKREKVRVIVVDPITETIIKWNE